MNPVGAPRTEIDIVDASVLISTGLKGITGFLIEAERGEVGVPQFVGSIEDYRELYGNRISNNDGPLLVERYLQKGGGGAVIVRAAKYINPADKNTLTGSLAAVNVTQTTASAAGAAFTTEATAQAVGTAGTVTVVASLPGQPDRVLANAVPVATVDTLADIADAVASAINLGTGTHEFVATNPGSPSADLVITAPSSWGAWGNQVRIRIITTSTVAFSSFGGNLSGGVDATVNTGTLDAEAKNIGAAWNGATITFVNSANNDINQYDVLLELPGSTVPSEAYTGFPKLASDTAFAGKVQDMLNRSKIISDFIAHSTFVIQPGTHTFAGGANSAIMSPNDYVGDATAQTNLHAFDEVTDITKICIPGVADPVLSKSLADWVDAREDVIGLHTTPVGLDANAVVEYRRGTGSYNHLPINSWRNFMFGGGLKITDPDDVNNPSPKEISEIGDVAGLISRKDNRNSEWFSFAGTERGVLTNILGVVVNVGSPAKRLQADLWDTYGINPVIMDPAKRVYINGNSTLWMEPTLLKKAEVAELLIFMYRSLQVLIPRNFNPNDSQTWKAIYRRVQPFMEAIKTGRGIWDYRYEGDQDIVDVSQAKVNKPADIDAGMYKFKLFIAPKVAMKYVGATIVVTNSGIAFENVVGDLL